MSEDYLKQYLISLESIGPLFIGSGHDLMKKEWIYDRRRKLGVILDERKLFTYLRKNQLLKSYEDFMLRENKRLYDWASEKNIYPGNIGEVKKYEVDCSGLVNAKTDKGVLLFIKDGYGMPYVPGSSLKGAVRNVILAKMIEDDPYDSNIIAKESRNPDRKPRMRFMANESRGVKQRYFNTKGLPGTKPGDMVNDVMSGIRISDSNPLEFDCLTMCQKIDIHVDGSEKDMPIIRECIKPGTRIDFSMSIDTTQTDITAEYIVGAVNAFLNNYNKEFLSKFESEYLYDKDVIYLGGGVGYHSKTVTSQILSGRKDSVEVTSNIIDNTLNNKAKQQHKHYRDKVIGVSPHVAKCTEYDGAIYQMGPCRIRISEV